jgi:hypothetical protein
MIIFLGMNGRNKIKNENKIRMKLENQPDNSKEALTNIS